MNKEQTLILKGIAIILMLFIHIDPSSCTNSSADYEIWKHIQSIAVPVPLFLIGGGYGLYISNLKYDKNRYRRIFRLYLSYWLTTLVAVSIAEISGTGTIRFDILSVINNLSAYHTTWNGTCWFIFPYTLLSLSAPYMFEMVKQLNAKIVVSVSFGISLVSLFFYSRFNINYATEPTLYHLTFSLSMIFCFILGGMTAREKWFEKIMEEISRWKKLYFVVYCTIVVIKICVSTTAMNGVFAYCIAIFTLNYVSTDSSLAKILKYLGGLSMNIWFVHIWILKFFGDAYLMTINPLLTLIVWMIICIPVALCFQRLEKTILNICANNK